MNLSLFWVVFEYLVHKKSTVFKRGFWKKNHSGIPFLLLFNIKSLILEFPLFPAAVT
jgi:hypothetical protein